jgi:hypothetical protein
VDAEVLVTVSKSDADEVRLEAPMLALREELLALDVENVHGVSEGSAPPGTRGLDLAAVGRRALSRRDVATNRSGLRQTRFRLEAKR